MVSQSRTFGNGIWGTWHGHKRPAPNQKDTDCDLRPLRGFDVAANPLVTVLPASELLSRDTMARAKQQSRREQTGLQCSNAHLTGKLDIQDLPTTAQSHFQPPPVGSGILVVQRDPQPVGRREATKPAPASAVCRCGPAGHRTIRTLGPQETMKCELD